MGFNEVAQHIDHQTKKVSEKQRETARNYYYRGLEQAKDELVPTLEEWQSLQPHEKIGFMFGYVDYLKEQYTPDVGYLSFSNVVFELIVDNLSKKSVLQQLFFEIKRQRKQWINKDELMKAKVVELREQILEETKS